MKYNFPKTGNQAVDDLGKQFEKIMRHCNQKSIKTRYRYAATGERFVRWVQPTFRLQKLANLADKHLIAYAKHLKSQGLSEKYIKNELSALRYIHSQTPHTRYELGESKKVNVMAGLGSTPNHKARDLDQTITKEELDRFCSYAYERGRPELAKMAESSYATGCRIEEIATLRRNDIEKALRTGVLYLKNTKGGRPRSVHLSVQTKRMFKMVIHDVPRGAFVFIPEGRSVHSYIRSAQDFIYRHRDNFQDPTRIGDPNRTEMHWHSFRHSFADNSYKENRMDLGDMGARQEVSEELGHSRASITYCYVK